MYNQIFLQRCVDLGGLGNGKVSPNPMVGAVLVYQNRIIGEGYHQAYGSSHAEVNAVASVRRQDRKLIDQSTLYVSLEPCCIYGKTPPCTNLIIEHNIPKVVIGTLDHTAAVAGKGVEILQKAGVEVVVAQDIQQVKWISRIRNHFVDQKRPYIVLKAAQSCDGFMGYTGEETPISNSLTKRLVHKWRHEFDAIMVGTNTARIDNPRLTNRLFYGSSPTRILLDRHLSLSTELHLFDGSVKTIIFYEDGTAPQRNNCSYVKITFDEHLLSNLFHRLAEEKITSVLVEGGPTLLNRLIKLQLWEETRVITNTNLYLSDGLPTPKLTDGQHLQAYTVGTDRIDVFVRS